MIGIFEDIYNNALAPELEFSQCNLFFSLIEHVRMFLKLQGLEYSENVGSGGQVYLVTGNIASEGQVYLVTRNIASASY